MTGPKINANKPLTTKPGTKRDASQKHKPLITSENNPRVKKLIGSDSTESTGRITELTVPTAMAASNADGKLAMSTPGTARSTINKPNAVANVVMRYPTMLLFMFKFNKRLGKNEHWFKTVNFICKLTYPDLDLA